MTPTTAMDAPTRAQLLIDKVDPKVTLSNKDKDAPIREWPNREIDEPMRPKDRRESDEPT